MTIHTAEFCIVFLYFFPISTLNVYGGGMSSFRTLPSALPGESRMEFDYYHAGTDEEFEAYYEFVRQVAREDFELCEGVQKGLENGVYTEGCLNGVKEGGVVWYQGRVRDAVYRQFEIEEAEKGKGCQPKDAGEKVGGEENLVEVTV